MLAVALAVALGAHRPAVPAHAVHPARPARPAARHEVCPGALYFLKHGEHAAWTRGIRPLCTIGDHDFYGQPYPASHWKVHRKSLKSGRLHK
jgi:hypothetical protein